MWRARTQISKEGKHRSKGLFAAIHAFFANDTQEVYNDIENDVVDVDSELYSGMVRPCLEVMNIEHIHISQ